MKDWKLIFNTNGYHYILIKEVIKENYLKFFFEHQNEIILIPSFYFILPTKEDIQANSTADYIGRFAPLLKIFMDDSSKKTLFIEEDVLKIIIKEDKLANFFKYLSKNNKNIVLFYYNDIDKYTRPPEFSSIQMTESDLELQYNLFDRFGDIKNAISRTHNPFKNPIDAFNKIQHDNK